MKKISLINRRKFKNLSQKQMATFMCMAVSNYSRRESGQIKISNLEWVKLGKILEVPTEEIYECNIFKTLKNDHNVKPFSDLHYLLDYQKIQIEKLEEENKKLTEKIRNIEFL